MMSTGYEVMPRARQLADQALQRRAYQKGFEFERLVEFLMWREPRSVLEIGTAEGGAWFAFAQAAHPEAVMVSVDLAPTLDEPCVDPNVLRSFCQPGQRVEIIRGDSQLEETRDLARAACPGGYDFLFIDGDHRLEAVTRDHELYGPLVKPGGIVGFHDIMEPAVRKIGFQRETQTDIFWERLEKPAGKTWEFIDYSDCSFGGIGLYER